MDLNKYGMRFFKYYLTVILVVLLMVCTSGDQANGKPEIEKLGIIAIDLVEATPFVFQNELYRLEWVRPKTKHNQGQDHGRIPPSQPQRAADPDAG